jgi:hypothetical protein
MKRVSMWFYWGVAMSFIWVAAFVPKLILQIYESYNPLFVAKLSEFMLVLDITGLISGILVKVFMTISALLYLLNAIEKYEEEQKEFEFEKNQIK